MTYSLFSYKNGTSFLHKMPAWKKILFIPLVNVLFLCLPPAFSIFLVIFQCILAFCLHFSLKTQITDLKPVIYYAILLFFVQLMDWLFSGPSIETFLKEFSWQSEKETLLFLLKIFAIMQSASLVFKTSTSLQLREGLGKIFGEKSLLTNALAMFLNFIPMLSKIWAESKRAWLARAGKKGIKMYLALLPVLFSVGMKKAYNASRALSIRM